MTPAQILRKARAILVKRGWIQEGFGDFDGPCCSLGALNQAEQRAPWKLGDANSPALKCFQEAIGAVGLDDVGRWNDKRGRTKRQVLAAFSKAIKLAEKRGRP